MKVYTEVRERDLWRCRACGLADLLEAHHIVYRSHGGADTLDNLITLCKGCHMAAHRMEITKDELYQLRDGAYATLRLLRAFSGSDILESLRWIQNGKN